MATIQIEVDEGLLTILDEATRELNINRSDFVSQAVEYAVRRHQIRKLEAQHARGYAQKPPMSGEFDGWDSEQIWTDG